MGRLAPGIELAGATAEMAAVANRLAELHPASNEDATVRITPLLEETVASFRPTLLTLELAVLLLLAAPCVNVAHLTLARSAARRQDMAVRVAREYCPVVRARQ